MGQKHIVLKAIHTIQKIRLCVAEGGIVVNVKERLTKEGTQLHIGGSGGGENHRFSEIASPVCGATVTRMGAPKPQ